jgi:hypothetical protein
MLDSFYDRVGILIHSVFYYNFRNRRARETSILQSIDNGARTLYEIVSKTYHDVDRKLWIPASFNARLHVDHLNSQHKLPKVSGTQLKCFP